LDSPRNNPYGLSGILIKTNGAILDNELFRFDNDPAAFYFFGHAICNGLEKRLREGETDIIDLNRAGLEWRHEYCQALSREIEKTLEPLILEKRKALEKKPEKEVKKTTKKMLRKLCSLLNKIAKEELAEEIVLPEPTPEITRLEIKPEIANIQIDKPRVFSIYAPENIIRAEGQKAHIKSDNFDIKPLATEVYLEKHTKYTNIWYRYFKIVGVKEDTEGNIEVKLGTEIAKARVKVAPPKEKKKGKLSTRKGGFISEIVPDESPIPSQRVVYTNGIIKIYIKFPSVSKFIGSGLDKIETPEGRILLAELVGEAFCKELARQGMETGKYQKAPTPDGAIDSFNAAINDLQKKHLHRIHEITSEWKFS
jgi:hypothetical protein